MVLLVEGRTAEGEASRRTLHTGESLLTDKQRARLEALFADEDHAEVEATWGVYRRAITAYREPDKTGKQLMWGVIDSVVSGLPAALKEIRKLGRTLKLRAADVLAVLRPPRHQLGFRNLTNCTPKCDVSLYSV
ncbi:hypothetical protein FH610_006145 [Microbispora catharanthi]|uniref:Transposase IS204/IS1001/IS1096/IS1165 DDE domain-containing protein n=1 Tax=Microbispora catharanthi TaxID=1712871 RepID=A0A5N6C107_9ACTN|nr:hypothetical protein FH610_006145 [Microbispora catharanthi]